MTHTKPESVLLKRAHIFVEPLLPRLSQHSLQNASHGRAKKSAVPPKLRDFADFILQLVLGPYLELNRLATMGPEWAGGRIP